MAFLRDSEQNEELTPVVQGCGAVNLKLTQDQQRLIEMAKETGPGYENTARTFELWSRSVSKGPDDGDKLG